jgi:hypothetical protein
VKLPEGIANQSKTDSDANTTDSWQPTPLYGPESHLVRRSDLVAIGGRSGHDATFANRSLVTQSGSEVCFAAFEDDCLIGYSITSSANTKSCCGIVSPSALAVLRLITV